MRLGPLFLQNSMGKHKVSKEDGLPGIRRPINLRKLNRAGFAEVNRPGFSGGSFI